MAIEDVKRSMRLPGSPGGSPLMDYNAVSGGQMKQIPLNVETPAIPGMIGPPFSVVSLPVEGGVRPDAGPAGSVPMGPDRNTPGVKLGPPITSTPGGDVFPKGSGTVANPGLPSVKPRNLPAVEIKEMLPERMPPDASYDQRFKPGESALNTVPMPGLQPGETAGLKPRAAE
jgi:hypothetical protein